MREQWRARAKCRDREDIDFFPEVGQAFPQVLKFCSDCPVKNDCLEYAIVNMLDDGYWGGMSANQRNLLRRRRARR